MTDTLNMDKFAQIPENLVADIRSNAKTLMLSHSIREELRDGMALEKVLAGYLPNMERKTLENAAQCLSDGVQSVYTSMEEEVDAKWVKQHLNKRMVNLKNKERVTYLGNLITAVRTAYPDIQMDASAVRTVNTLCNAEDNTDADVSAMLDLTGTIIWEHAGMIRRQSVAAMEKRLHKLDHETIISQVSSGMDSAIAYAAACYIAQQCGDLTKINKQDASDMPPYLIGVAAASGIESSKLMELYSTGKITMAALQSDLEKLFTSALVFVCDHVVLTIAIGMQIVLSINLFNMLLPLMAEWLFFSPVLIVLATAGISVFVSTQLVTTRDFVDVINMVWNLAKSLWNKMFGNHEAEIQSTPAIVDASAIAAEDEDEEEDAEESDAEKEEDLSE